MRMTLFTGFLFQVGGWTGFVWASPDPATSGGGKGRPQAERGHESEAEARSGPCARSGRVESAGQRTRAIPTPTRRDGTHSRQFPPAESQAGTTLAGEGRGPRCRTATRAPIGGPSVRPPSGRGPAGSAGAVHRGGTSGDLLGGSCPAPTDR